MRVYSAWICLRHLGMFCFTYYCYYCYILVSRQDIYAIIIPRFRKQEISHTDKGCSHIFSKYLER